MNDSASSLPIVVGIDGSKHALRAAMWALDEAVSRDAQLLLTCVIDPNSRDLERYAYAGNVLHKAWASVEGAGKPVKLESTVLEGDPISQLVQISRSAQMICVGSRGQTTPRITSVDLPRRNWRKPRSHQLPSSGVATLTNPYPLVSCARN